MPAHPDCRPGSCARVWPRLALSRARQSFADLAGSLDRRQYDNARLRAASLVPLMEAVAHIRLPGASSRLLDLLALVDVRRESPLESFSSTHTKPSFTG